MSFAILCNYFQSVSTTSCLAFSGFMFSSISSYKGTQFLLVHMRIDLAFTAVFFKGKAFNAV